LQGSLFITNDYLRFKRRKLGSFHRFSLKNKLQEIFSRSCALVAYTRAHKAHGAVEPLPLALMTHEAVLVCEILRFRPIFDRFFV